MIKGYITLKQAAEISGRTVEALKKQCQVGKVRGAIKQGKTWFVPQSEIIVDDFASTNGTLTYLASLVESSSSSKNPTRFGVIIFMNGVVVSGDLVSRAYYLDKFKNDILSNVAFGDAVDKKVAQKFVDFTDKYFGQMKDDKETGLPTFLHLDDITFWHGDSSQTLSPGLLRIKTSEVDGFMLGKLGSQKVASNE